MERGENDCGIDQQPPISKPQEVTQDHSEHTYIHRIADISIESHRNQYFGRIDRSRRAASLSQEIPEAPQKDRSADQPEWDGKPGKNACFNLRTSAQQTKWNVACHHAGCD